MKKENPKRSSFLQGHLPWNAALVVGLGASMTGQIHFSRTHTHTHWCPGPWAHRVTSVSAFLLAQTEQWSNHPCSYTYVSLSLFTRVSLEPQPSSSNPPLFPLLSPLLHAFILLSSPLFPHSVLASSSTSLSIPEVPSCLSMFSFSLLFTQPSHISPSLSAFGFIREG